MTAAISPADVLAVGLVTPVGLSAVSTAAAVRAGICRFQESAIRDRNREPHTLSLVDGQYLPVLDPSIGQAAAMIAARARMLALSTFALREACAPCTAPPPLLLALPEERPGSEEAHGVAFARDMALQAGVELDQRSSSVYRRGGAGGLCALRDALTLLAAGRFPCVLVGAVDTFLDLARLAELDSEGRLAPASVDGLIPGEGAGFLLLGARAARKRMGPEPLAQVTAVATGVESGHRYSKEPYRGDGLAEAFQALFASLPQGHPRVRTVYAGFNGEGLAAKEWGVAYLRSAEWFAEELRVEHPADCIGDAGVALGPIMLGLAALGIRRGHREPPCLVWSTSDHEVRAAALLAAAE